MKPIAFAASIALWSLLGGWSDAQSAVSIPHWMPDSRMLQRLGPPIQVSGFALQPPQGYGLQRFRGPLGVTGSVWVSAPRPDGVREYVMAGTVTPPHSEMNGFTLEKAIDDYMKGVASRRTHSQRTPTEKGVVNGLTLARVYWHGIDRATGFHMSGFIYIAREGATVLYLSSQDVEPYTGALPLAEASVLTMRKSSGVAPAANVQQGRLAPVSIVQKGRPMAAMIPNEFELNGEGVHITYSTSSIAGTPQLNYTHGGQHKTFTGVEIQSEPSVLGQLVTVTLDAVPDLRTDTLTLVVPEIHQDGHDVHFATFAILTTARTSVAGPGRVKGPLQSYQVIPLHGVAKSLAF